MQKFYIWILEINSRPIGGGHLAWVGLSKEKHVGFSCRFVIKTTSLMRTNWLVF